MPVLFMLMLGVNRYYRDVEKEIEVDPTTTFGAQRRPRDRARRQHAEARPQGARLRHRRPARAHRGGARLDRRRGDRAAAGAVEQQNIQVPLRVIESPYRDISFPLIKYIKKRRAEHGSEVDHGLHAAVHRRALVGEPAAQPQGPAHPPEAACCATASPSRSCRGCWTPRADLRHADSVRCPARTAVASRCGKAVVRKPMPPAVPLTRTGRRQARERHETCRRQPVAKK